METAALQVSINTQAARADLTALAKAFDRVEGSFNSLDRAFARSAGSIDRNSTKAVKGFDKVARVAALLGKIKISTNSVDAIHKFTAAIDGLGKARSISDAKIGNLRKFMVLASTIKAPTGINGLAHFMQVISTVKAPSAGTNARLTAFFKAVQGFRAPQGSGGLAQLLATFATMKVPTTAQISRLRELLTVLGSAKSIAGANHIARDLDMIAASAGRAGAAINSMPSRMRNIGAGAGQAHNNVRRMSGGLHELNNRLSVGYQLGTAFTTMFSTFTLGAFFREVWKTNIEMAKLEKSMLFATGSIDGQKRATADAIAMFQQLGMRIDVAADSYARFAISATAAGFSIQQTQAVFGAVGQALQVVGATSQQVEYAMYGLTQMMQKGKVSSEEFNRQIGEQLPGNAAVGARALSRVLGRQVEVAEFFDLMAKGQIQSATFAPAWAAELDKMYEPLRGLVDLRPDIALNRLKNAFTLFTLEVGKAGFMAGMGEVFGNLTSRLIDDQGQLTSAGRDLAEQWGRNLAKAVRTLGSVLEWVADHMQEVMNVVKGLIGLRLAATFYQWGAGAKAATKDMFTFAASAATAKNSVAAAPVATTGAVSRRVQQAAAAAPVVTPIAGGRMGPPRPGTGGAGAAGHMRAQMTAMRGTATVATGAARGMNAMAIASTAMSVGARTAAGAFNLMRGALSMTMPVLLAAGVALAAFGSNATTVGGKTVTFNDIVMSGFQGMGRQITNWWNETKDALKGFGMDMDGMGSSAGDVLASVMAGFQTLVQTIFGAAQSIGEIIGTVLGEAIGQGVTLFGALWMAVKGDFAGAGRLLADSVGGTMSNISSLGERIAGRFDIAGNYQENRNNIVLGAQDTAEARARGDAQTEALMRRNQEASDAAAAAVAAQQEADRIATAQGRREAAIRALSAGPMGELDTFQTIMGQMAEITERQTRATEQLTTATQDNTRASTQGGPQGTGAEIAFSMIKQHEGFRSTAYPDWTYRNGQRVNSGWRVGYGSDTITDPATGRVTTVRQGMTGITREQADADLQRRIRDDFMVQARTDLGADLFNSLSPSIQAALTSVTYNYGTLGRTRSGGGAGIADEIRAGQTSPEQIARLIEGLAGHNNGVNRRRRLEEAAVVRSGWTGEGGQSVAQMTEAEAQTFEERGVRMRDTYERIIGVNPAQAAVSTYNRFLVDLTQFKDDMAEASAAGAELTWVNQELFAAAERKLRQDMEDAANPLGKQRRADEHANQMIEARLNGARDEAGFMERVIDLREQGYEFESEAGRQRLETERRLYEVTQARTRELESQMSLVETERDIRVQQIARNGSAFEGALAARIMSSAGEGRSYDQAVADAQADGSYGNMVAEVRASEAERVQSSMQAAMRELAEMQSSARLRGVAAERHGNYRTYLEELTGLTGRTVAEMERMEPQLAGYARHLADARTALDNPPGFQRWIDSLKPLADALEDIKVTFAEGLSDGITSALMGEDFDWGDLAKTLRRQWTKSIVDNALGSLFQRGVDRANGGGIPGLPGAPGAANDNQSRGGVVGSIMGLFGMGSGGSGAAGDPMAAATGEGAYTINAASVVVNAQSMAGGAPGGDMSKLASMFGGDAQTGTLGGKMATLGGKLGSSAAGGGNPMMSFLGDHAGTIIGVGATLFDMFAGKKDKKPEKQYSMGDVNGIIGSMSTNTVDGTAIAAKSNPIADILNLGLQLAGGAFGAGNGGTPYGMGGDLRSMFGSFREGGISTQPVEWAAMPHYREGTANTDGIPAVLHPNEAVIPLSRGRKVPVEMSGGAGGTTTNVNNFTIVANDPNEFRQAEASIQRRQNRAARRNQLRNLT